MSNTAQPVKTEETNRIGLTKKDYKGLPSTMCPGCGHNSISEGILTAFYELGVSPYQVAKMSGIGCSSKTPAYFLHSSHGFNAVHGRMPSVATGAALANRNLIVLGVSGDGDSASIGIGQMIHSMRRNTKMIYIVENNGTYGLTKGQFSATADVGSTDHYGLPNDQSALDLPMLAIISGCKFVARGFSGDRKQMLALLKAAIHHDGLAFLDIMSPCVTFNDHPGSTKSYEYVKAHDEKLHEIDFIEEKTEINVEFEEGTYRDVSLHDGSIMRLKKLDRDYDPSSKLQALGVLQEAFDKKEVVTGLIYYDKNSVDQAEALKLPQVPLHEYGAKELRPSKEALTEFLKSFK
ncbi:MAG: 2-oxoacid:ferredoxin oxidoreductase subunit beta [Deltaproteobacteria bacterium]|nr:2-oxoacid:ferredoxin oxidoreductase subunit beta [Deltaproteobacteria bacterium]